MCEGGGGGRKDEIQMNHSIIVLKNTNMLMNIPSF